MEGGGVSAGLAGWLAAAASTTSDTDADAATAKA